jgi:hypothetical protein
MSLIEEYNQYISYLGEKNAELNGTSPREITKCQVVIGGFLVRCGQIISDLEAEGLIEYGNLLEKNPEVSNAKAKELVKVTLLKKHDISILHFENLHRDLKEFNQILKKRLSVLVMELEGGF